MQPVGGGREAVIYNQTYLLPERPSARLDVLDAVVRDLVGKRAVVGPFTVVTGSITELPFSTYSDLAECLLQGAPPPAGAAVAYRGSKLTAVSAALHARGDGDVIVCFADVPPIFDDVPPERAHPVLFCALARPREIQLHQQQYDADFRPIPGTELATYRMSTAAIICGTDLDGPRYHPVRNIAAVLEKHLGPVAQESDILH